MATGAPRSADRHSVDAHSFSQEGLPCESLRKCNGLTRSELGNKFLVHGPPGQRTGEDKFKDLCAASEAARWEAERNSVDLLLPFGRHPEGEGRDPRGSGASQTTIPKVSWRREVATWEGGQRLQRGLFCPLIHHWRESHRAT